jgi:sugar lactone lactonase YvrE
MAIKIERIGETRDQLGEGPLWDVAEQALYWVDSTACRLHRLDWPSGGLRDWDLPGMIGSLALRAAGGAVLALETGFHFFDFDRGEATPIVDPEAEDDRTRFNDGKVDRQGRFLSGTMGKVIRNPPIGSLYRLDSDGAVACLENDIGVSNGPCFSPDGRTFYFSDSTAQSIYAYDYDCDKGTVSNRRVLVDVARLESAPDGCTVDAQGHLWSALVRSGQIGEFDADGRLLRRIDMPCRIPSSVMFGGPNLDILFVTSISNSGNREAEGDENGGLYAIHGLGVQGLPEPRFEG